jgi:hypothetical protein
MKLIRPDPELLSLLADNNRVSYLSSDEQGLTRIMHEAADELIGPVKHGIISPVERDIALKFGGNSIGIRATVASLYGSFDMILHPYFFGTRIEPEHGLEVQSKQTHLMDINAILEEGCEHKDRETIRLMEVQNINDGFFSIMFPTYLLYYSFEFNGSLQGHPDLQRKVFPVILVYDLTNLKPNPESSFSYILPSDPSERKEIILHAYVCDLLLNK